MLQSLRKSAASLVIKLLAFLLVASFAVWGISDTYIFGQVGSTVAEVGKREITVPVLQRAFRREVDRLRQFNIDEQKAREIGLLDQTLNRLVSTTLIESAAQDLGMVIGKSSLREEIRKQFGGTVDTTQFQNALRNNGLSEGQYLAQLSGDMIRSQYLESLTVPARAPNQLADRLYRWREEKREAEWFTVPVDPNSPVRAPSDQELEAYYKANQQNYKAPEFRSARYVHIDPAAQAKDITVSEDKLKSAYEDRLDSLVVPESRTVLQMLLPDMATAEKARTRLNAGEDFIAVAKDLAGQDESATRLGTVTRKDLPDELAEKVFTLSKGVVSEPVQGPFGLQLLKIVEIAPGKTPTLEEVRPMLTKELAREEAIDAVFDLANRLEEAIGGGAKLDEAARELGLTVHTLKAVSADGRDRSDKPVAELPGPPFLETLFATAQGEDSLLTEAAENAFFILHVDAVVPSEVRSLDTVRDEVREDWKQAERWKMARATAKSLVERLNAGAKIAEISGKSGYKLRSSGAFNRAGQGLTAGMSPELASALFDAAATGHTAMADGRDGVQVAQLKAISKAAVESDRKGVEALANTLQAGIAGDVAGQLDMALRKRHDVKIDRRVLNYYFYRDAGDS